MEDSRFGQAMHEPLAVWGAAGLAVLVLFWLVDGWLFAFGVGVAVGLVIAYEIVRRWISCLL